MFNFDDYEINNIKGEPINEEENERITKILKLNNSALYLNNSILYDFLRITLYFLMKIRILFGINYIIILYLNQIINIIFYLMTIKHYILIQQCHI